MILRVMIVGKKWEKTIWKKIVMEPKQIKIKKRHRKLR